mmetsp:Transcript_41165/g.102408  ORF Transcript_41165/g.102408 Transcript_41165/m.102408 type:complete len:329 (+) Transcript_41165:407-1393(+)
MRSAVLPNPSISARGGNVRAIGASALFTAKPSHHAGGLLRPQQRAQPPSGRERGVGLLLIHGRPVAPHDSRGGGGERAILGERQRARLGWRVRRRHVGVGRRELEHRLRIVLLTRLEQRLAAPLVFLREQLRAIWRGGEPARCGLAVAHAHDLRLGPAHQLCGGGLAILRLVGQSVAAGGARARAVEPAVHAPPVRFVEPEARHADDLVAAAVLTQADGAGGRAVGVEQRRLRGEQHVPRQRLHDRLARGVGGERGLVDMQPQPSGLLSQRLEHALQVEECRVVHADPWRSRAVGEEQLEVEVRRRVRRVVDDTDLHEARVDVGRGEL